MSKKLVTFCILLFSTIGSYLPVWFFHQSELSFASLLAGGAGGLFGIYAAVKINEYF